MVKKVLIFWRDIPSQVILQRGRRREKVMLSDRFQEAIDRAAMRAGKGGSEAYLAEWRRERTAIDGAGDSARDRARRGEPLRGRVHAGAAQRIDPQSRRGPG